MSFVFVIGTGRCGSSLLAELLVAHPDVTFVPEAGPRGVPRPSEAYELLEREVSQLVSAPCRDLTEQDAIPWVAERFRRFFEERRAASGKAIFLHKFTGWPRARFIHAILPESRFVHIVRDGRAVASSLLKVSWWLGYRGPTEWSFGPLPDPYREEWERADRSFALLAGLEWKLLLDAFEASRARVPAASWLDVRYEDLVARPREHLREISEFAGLAWSRRFEKRLDAIPVDPSRCTAYEDDLGADCVRLLTASLSQHLERWGYPQRNPAG